MKKEFVIRLLTGVIFAAVVVGATLASPWSFLALLAVVGVGCLWELWRLMRGSVWMPVVGLLYVVLPLAILWYMTTMHVYYDRVPQWSGSSVRPLFFMAMVWTNDVFAYLVGSAIGKHKMAPHISPRKSWEGFGGGIIATMGAGMLAAHLLANPLIWGAGFGVATGLGAVGGDLLESWLKRRARVKDSGNILPGHGGFLDRFDALLGAIPCATIYLILTAIW